jgi:hypothetical protein
MRRSLNQALRYATSCTDFRSASAKILDGVGKGVAEAMTDLKQSKN